MVNNGLHYHVECSDQFQAQLPTCLLNDVCFVADFITCEHWYSAKLSQGRRQSANFQVEIATWWIHPYWFVIYVINTIKFLINKPMHWLSFIDRRCSLGQRVFTVGMTWHRERHFLGRVVLQDIQTNSVSSRVISLPCFICSSALSVDQVDKWPDTWWLTPGAAISKRRVA